ncbi:hypothetical protein CEXT_33151 [Caerostris extrusa]|uniref:Uncharacterized protein n=1 Tax=Caerostris extrusa TaxID=172846 RepID=A0AAV4XU20_CAEEX|nr:hypothetical protein CEXT_33151 [Caerostris extrusa]
MLYGNTLNRQQLTLSFHPGWPAFCTGYFDMGTYIMHLMRVYICDIQKGEDVPKLRQLLIKGLVELAINSACVYTGIDYLLVDITNRYLNLLCNIY